MYAASSPLNDSAKARAVWEGVISGGAPRDLLSRFLLDRSASGGAEGFLSMSVCQG